MHVVYRMVNIGLKLYEASGDFEITGLLLVITLGLITSLPVGYMWQRLTVEAEVEIIFAFAAGMAIGSVLKMCLRLGHCRSKSIASVVVAFLAFTTLIVKNYVRFSYERKRATESITLALAKHKPELMNDAQAISRIIDGFWCENYGEHGFLSYLYFIVTKGITEQGNNKGPDTATCVMFFLVEVYVVIQAAWFFAMGWSKEPYCEKCKQWAEVAVDVCTEPETIKVVNGTLIGYMAEINGCDGLLCNLPPPEPADLKLHYGEVKLKKCPVCGVGFLSLNDVYPDGWIRTHRHSVLENAVLSKEAAISVLSTST